jgi:hypothetical protein
VQGALIYATRIAWSPLMAIMGVQKIDGIRDGKATKMQHLNFVQQQVKPFNLSSLLTIEWE